MAKKMIVVIVFLAVYVLVFFIGYRSGAAVVRMKKPIEAEVIAIPMPSAYYLFSKYDYGGQQGAKIEVVTDSNAVIRIFKNEKLRPLLKDRGIEIYSESGERLF